MSWKKKRQEEKTIIMRTLRDTVDPFNLTDQQFTKVFRLSKDAVNYLCNALELTLQRRRTNGLCVKTQVLAALRFFAIGSYQKGIGNDYLVSISQPAVSRVIKAVAVGITQILADEWIQFPRTEEKRAALKRRFQDERNFKDVIGCIDCTHVAMVRPKEHEEAYANHKGFHSINVQAVQMFNVLVKNYRYLYKTTGDAGYFLEPWLMTPITNAPEGSAEARYTQYHCSTRNCVERTFDLLKNVWTCLLSHRVLRSCYDSKYNRSLCCIT
ncbi:Putative nuclease HARBI1 [Trachymyrmex zeteki]|uniref:Putative nuclease HARBI1 n=1 Tax=Mycetomoellerius zeteki TaxID=64791 RepID=A0A151WFQ1_9HYME|nr:Putative nuclease HARBI1 [Trachymyrmex zeteki]